jgi:hypothetical protein
MKITYYLIVNILFFIKNLPYWHFLQYQYLNVQILTHNNKFLM